MRKMMMMMVMMMMMMVVFVTPRRRGKHRVFTVLELFLCCFLSVSAKDTAFVEVVLFESSPSGDYTTYTTGLQGRFSRAGATISAEGEIVQCKVYSSQHDQLLLPTRPAPSSQHDQLPAPNTTSSQLPTRPAPSSQHDQLPAPNTTSSQLPTRPAPSSQHDQL
ncbi:E3 ubiquitin-protein ligase znrf3, partial [Tachysurus ichikawai]